MKLKRNMAILLSILLLLAQMPLGAFAFEAGQGAAGVKNGVYTARDDAVYTVLYNDYITLYVNKLNGGFAVLPATESFDDAKPLSHATFRIDGKTYEYGAYYSGVSGAVSMAPEVNADNILESHWQIGDFVVSQIFAITSDTLHDDSYMVKIGYAAQYFGEGEANIAGRVLLDTEFTPDESVPLLLMDSEDNLLLVETEAEFRPVPPTALISKEFIEEANLEAGTAVYTDSPNKGYLLFADPVFTTPNSVMFAEFGRADGAEFDYAPDWAHMLFDGSGADSAALLCWDEVSVSSGNQAAFGTNYGFYDLKRGNPRFDPAPAPARSAGLRSAISAMAVGETATVNVQNIDQFIPDDWFEIRASVALNKETDEFGGSFLQGVTDDSDLQIQLAYKSAAPQIIRDAVRKIRIEARWDGGGDNWSWSNYGLENGDLVENEEILIDSLVVVPMAEAFSHRAAGEDLSIIIVPIIEPPAGHALISAAVSLSSPLASATLSLTGTGTGTDETALYGKDSNRPYADLYIVTTGAEKTLTAEMAGLQYKINDDTNVFDYNPEVKWDLEAPAALPSKPGDLTGPLTHTYTFDIPSGAERGEITVYTKTSGLTVPQPVNVKAYYASNNAVQTEIENLLYNAVEGVTRDQGVIWAMPNETVTIEAGALNTLNTNSSYSGGTLKVYQAGTKTAPTGVSNPISSGSFTMPDEPIDLVYENGTTYRVLTAVTGGGSATVVVNSLTPGGGTGHGADPQTGDDVYIYVTNIEDGYKLKDVTAIDSGSNNVPLTAEPGGSWTFTMPNNTDVTVTAELETVAIPPTYHSVVVKPMASDGRTLYDVMFWTDAATGGRQAYQVDEAGRGGQVPVGATVHYAVYPTNWDTTAGSVDNMLNWVVTDFTMNGATVSGFAGINTDPADGHAGIGYFPYNYNSADSTNAGSFTMPDEDVTLELTGYRANRTQNLTAEVYDQKSGARLPEIESAVYTRSVQTGAEWAAGAADLPLGYGVYISAPTYAGVYEVQGASLVINDEWTPIPVDAAIYPPPNNTRVAYKTDPVFAHGAVIRIEYKDISRKLAIKGFEPADPQAELLSGTGEVLVYPQSSNTAARDLSVMPDENGNFTTTVTMHWVPGLEEAHNYRFTGASGAKLLSSNNYSATYQVTVTDPDAVIGIEQYPVASDINFGDIQINSPNSQIFREITFNAGGLKNLTGGEVGFTQNLRNYLRGDNPTPIQKITLAGETGGAIYTAEANNLGGLLSSATSAKYYEAFSFPAVQGLYHYIAGFEEGQIMTLDIRKLFGIGDDEYLPDDDYTLTVDWGYGEWVSGLEYSEKGSKSYTFTLGKNLYARGEMEHIGVVQDPATKAWQIVTGISYEQMNKKAEAVNAAGPLLTFYCERYGFKYENGRYEGETGFKSVVMNGHAYFKDVAVTGYASDHSFTIQEIPGGTTEILGKPVTIPDSIQIVSEDMSLGSSWLPFFWPHRIGTFGVDTLRITLENGKEYDIPSRYPVYEKDDYGGNAAQAKEAWLASIEEMRENMVLIEVVYPEDITTWGLSFTDGSIGVSLAGFEGSGGLTMSVRDMYLLGHGLDVGGVLNLQIPFTQHPIARFVLESALTDNTAKVIPFDNIWAEGETAVQVPEYLGGFNATAQGVFNTYTQDFGFEGGVNLWVFKGEGAFYLARSERLHIPIADRMEVGAGFDGVFAGIGIPPVPAQIIEIHALSAGIENIADLWDYDPTRNTIPNLRIKGGAEFSAVEVLSFGGSFWAELASLSISVNGGISVGPFSFPILRDLTVEGGWKDGPFAPYDVDDRGFWVKGKRSMVWFTNANLNISVFSAEMAGGFYINMKISPFLWESRDNEIKDMKDFEVLWKYLDISIEAGGHLYAALTMGDYSILDADARFVIALKPGKDVKKYPLMPHTFKIIATEHFLGMEVGEQELDILAKIPNMSDWLDEQNGTGKYAANSLSAAAAAESQLKLMSAAIADPAAAGLEVDAGYKGTYRNLAFGNVAAVSDSRSAAPAAPAPMGLRALRAITQDTANIKVDYDGSVYTHFVAVPQGGNGYVLQLEGFGGSALTSADLRVFKPNGQALTVREVAGAVTAAQAESGYNAAVIDGVLTLSLADFKNADTTVSAAPVITVGGNTLPGVWQVVSDKPFKSSLVTLNAVPRVKSVELTDAGVLTATFENIGDTTGGDYYYDVTLERKGDPRAQALETPLTIAANESVVNSSQAITMDLTQLPVGNAAGDTYDISEIAASGDWYANVTLLQGGMETFNSGTENEIELLTTDFVDERYSATPYRVTSWLEALAWNANLQASSGGNQSIDVSFDPVASNDVPDGMVVSGYHVTVYDDATKLPASRRATDADGAQSVSSMEYNIPTSENDSGRYEYNIPEVPVGAYTVGAAPLYADLNPTVDEENNVIKDEDGNTVYEASPVLRRGAEVKTPAAITVSEANPPSLTFSVTGGNIVEENGLRYIFAGEKAALTAAATGGAAVTYYEFNGTPITSAQGALDAETLAAHTGKALIVSARNGQGDSATEYLTLYAGISAPLLVPDNYDPNNGSFTFTAYKNTGNYTVTGQADPGAAIGGAIADENGRFSFSGTLDSGADSEDFTLTAANAAGLVTMREINIVRGNVNENAGAPTPNGGTGGGGGGAQPPAAPVTVSRASLSYISGADRVLTSVAISRQGWESADAVILAPGGQNNLIDALAAAPLAGQENAPILLSTGTLDPAVVAEIQRLGAKKIYVVGAIGQDVIGALRAALPGVTVEILQGSNRFETAALVGAKLTNPQGTFVVGYNAVADAVSAASFAAANGYAIQIADPDGWFARPLPVADAGSATIGSIRESGAQPDSANGSASDDHDTTRVNPDLPVYILGGPTLVRDIAGATRLYGATRYETNKAIRDALAFEYTNIYTANGDTLVDALTGSALAAQTRAAIVLTPGNDPTGVDFGNITHETKVFAFGG